MVTCSNAVEVHRQESNVEREREMTSERNEHLFMCFWFRWNVSPCIDFSITLFYSLKNTAQRNVFFFFSSCVFFVPHSYSGDMRHTVFVYFDSFWIVFPHCAIIHNLYVINCVELMLVLCAVYIGIDFITKTMPTRTRSGQSTLCAL